MPAPSSRLTDGRERRSGAGDRHAAQHSGAVDADERAAVLPSQTAAVVDEEAAAAGEFVSLLGDHTNGELFSGEISAGQFERLGCVGLVDVDRRRLGFAATSLQLFERILIQVFGLRTPWRVVISSHCVPYLVGVGAEEDWLVAGRPMSTMPVGGLDFTDVTTTRGACNSLPPTKQIYVMCIT